MEEGLTKDDQRSLCESAAIEDPTTTFRAIIAICDSVQW